MNGVLPLDATRADIIRSLLTVGYPSRKEAVKVVGRWRERMLVAMATGYLDRSLRTTRYFRSLEQTEKVGVSFLLGEAFTHWYAQRHMDVEYLVHVTGVRDCKWVTPAKSMAVKSGASPPPLKSRPDFIGIRRTERHVFESKGRQRKPSGSAEAKALGQVSALSSINGKKPTTRCATFFMLKAAGAEGKVIDPPEEQAQIGVVFDERDAMAKAYSFFLDNPTVSLADQIGPGYVGREIETDVFFGIDKKVLAAISERPASARARRVRVQEIFSILAGQEQVHEARRSDNESPGPDGTLLVDRRPRNGHL
ncbi:hypothetical protein [Bradyrhizobium diazoefficiens]|uniref:hypothetical protein n=1 Tax=Bradyrhizobium diazoefficiens TaxID=1355477 RepID=UPI001FCA9C6F|nr:hypothetical protein [Bradyrhizobium diazoefficiens]